MKPIDKLVRAAKRRNWHVDTGSYAQNPQAGRVVFTATLKTVTAVVFYAPTTGKYFGTLQDGTQFSSDDLDRFLGTLWFHKLWCFFNVE
jgi:hypothetical protein